MAGALVDDVTCGEDGGVKTRVSLVGGDEADAAMAVDVVVPSHESLDPDLSLPETSEGPIGEGRAVLEGAEERLGESIVV